jgi:hypothetical protein
MTDQEVQEFIDAVKGKKITKKSWRDKSTFVPIGSFNRSIFNNSVILMGGFLYSTTAPTVKTFRSYEVGNGFADWEFVEEQDRYDRAKVWKTIDCTGGKIPSNNIIDALKYATRITIPEGYKIEYLGPKQQETLKGPQQCEHPDYVEIPGFMPGKFYRNCKVCGIKWEDR